MDLPFERVFVINLDRRQDRWKRFNNTAQHQQIKFERFPATDGREVDHLGFAIDWKQTDVPLNVGVIGCWLTHRRLLEYIEQNSIETALILEDDITFPPNFQERFARLWKQTPSDWDMLYLARANWDNQIYSPDRYLSPLRVNEVDVPEIYVADRSTTAHSYAVNLRCVPEILRSLNSLQRPIDEHYACLHKNMTVYAYHPALIRHSTSTPSDIDNSAIYLPERP